MWHVKDLITKYKVLTEEKKNKIYFWPSFGRCLRLILNKGNKLTYVQFRTDEDTAT